MAIVGDVRGRAWEGYWLSIYIPYRNINEISSLLLDVSLRYRVCLTIHGHSFFVTAGAFSALRWDEIARSCCCGGFTIQLVEAGATSGILDGIQNYVIEKRIRELGSDRKW
jgi:hypothetical protein